MPPSARSALSSPANCLLAGFLASDEPLPENLRALASPPPVAAVAHQKRPFLARWPLERVAQESLVNVSYWIDGKFGYALSAGIDKGELAHVATAVYDQLERR